MKQIHNKHSEFSEFEKSLMKQLLHIANIHIRKPYPNPKVAAAIYKDETVISIGVHQKKGCDHAEVLAIKQAEEPIKGASIMVTLEPCTHKGSTPACVDAIIKSGIKKVIFACFDPFSAVQQNPAKEILKQHNIDVKTGLLEKEALNLNHDYFYAHTYKKPWVHLKAAMSLDGKIALHNNKSKYITGKESLQRVHELRSKVAAIIIGANTLKEDDPSLTIRFDYLLKDNVTPVLIVIGSTINPKTHYKIFESGYKTILVTSTNLLTTENTFFSEVWFQPLLNQEFDWGLFMKKCYEENLFSVMLEGGSHIFSSALQHKIVNQYSFFIAPKLVGDNSALPVVNFGNIDNLEDVMNLDNMSVEKLGRDILVTGYC